MSSDIQREARAQLEYTIRGLGLADRYQVDQEVVLRRAAPLDHDLRSALARTGIIDYWFKAEVDLLVRDRRDEAPLLAIEVDGQQHRTDPTTIDRDRKKNALFALAEVRLFRVERPDLTRWCGSSAFSHAVEWSLTARPSEPDFDASMYVAPIVQRGGAWLNENAVWVVRGAAKEDIEHLAGTPRIKRSRGRDPDSFDRPWPFGVLGYAPPVGLGDGDDYERSRGEGTCWFLRTIDQTIHELTVPTSSPATLLALPDDLPAGLDGIPRSVLLGYPFADPDEYRYEHPFWLFGGTSGAEDEVMAAAVAWVAGILDRMPPTALTVADPWLTEEEP